MLGERKVASKLRVGLFAWGVRREAVQGGWRDWVDRGVRVRKLGGCGWRKEGASGGRKWVETGCGWRRESVGRGKVWVGCGGRMWTGCEGGVGMGCVRGGRV